MASDIKTDPSFRKQVPEGDNRERRVCQSCGFIDYQNPRIIVGAVVLHEGRVLLCRRAIDPRRDYWTLPAGFLEMHETADTGAKREAWEEAGVRLDLHGLHAVYSVPEISQIQIMYRATLREPGFFAGPESLEVAFFAWDEIPWERLAFQTVEWALHQARVVADRWTRVVHVFGNPAGAAGGATAMAPEGNAIDNATLGFEA